MIPFDQRKPLDPSGIRIGTAALTTRGMTGNEMKRVGKWILEVLRRTDKRCWSASARDRGVHQDLPGAGDCVTACGCGEKNAKCKGTSP